MDEEIFCKRNKFGYCKFGDRCHYIHENQLCLNVNCDGSCLLRHPRDCYYFNKFRNCKFGEWCKYGHEKIENEDKKKREYCKDKHDKIILEILDLKTEIEDLKKENATLKKKQKKLNIL